MNKFNFGKLFVTGIEGITLKIEEAKFIRDNELAGVILFSKNYESKNQVKELIDSIQKIDDRKKLILVDHEGGRVQRFRQEFTIVPSAHEISLSASPTNCFNIYEKIAVELNEVGVNYNLAPCADILTNPSCEVIGDRAFGKNADDASRFVRAAIRGLQTNKVLSCAKHFPGHGDTKIDSHLDLPVSERTFQQLIDEDINVFKTAIKAKVFSIMMAHMIVRELDNEFPISLSKKAHDFLKNEIGFSGIIISDDMDMGAITKHFLPTNSALLALKAGTHLVEYRSFESCKKVVDELNKNYSNDIELIEILNQRFFELENSLNKFFS